MTDTSTAAPAATHSRRSGGGRDGRRALRATPMASFPTLVREIPVYNLVPDEAVQDHTRSAAIRMAGWPAGTLAGIKAALRRPLPQGGDVFDAVQARPGQGGAAPSRVARP